MIAAFVASVLLNTQPDFGRAQLIVELCNYTPAPVSFSVIYPTGRTTNRRRGWLAAAPGDCLSGGIGRTVGGDAYVHARSGDFRWPSGSADLLSCLPGRAHDDAADAPPCSFGAAQFRFERVRLSAQRGSYRLRYTVSCSDLSDDQQRWCRSSGR